MDSSRENILYFTRKKRWFRIGLQNRPKRTLPVLQEYYWTKKVIIVIILLFGVISRKRNCLSLCFLLIVASCFLTNNYRKFDQTSFKFTRLLRQRNRIDKFNEIRLALRSELLTKMLFTLLISICWYTKRKMKVTLNCNFIFSRLRACDISKISKFLLILSFYMFTSKVHKIFFSKFEKL